MGFGYSTGRRLAGPELMAWLSWGFDELEQVCLPPWVLQCSLVNGMMVRINGLMTAGCLDALMLQIYT